MEYESHFITVLRSLSHTWYHFYRVLSHFVSPPHVSLCRCWSGHSCYLLCVLHVLQCAHELGTLLFVQLVRSNPPLEVLQQHLECCWKLFQRFPWQQHSPAVRQPTVLRVRIVRFIFDGKSIPCTYVFTLFMALRQLFFSCVFQVISFEISVFIFVCGLLNGLECVGLSWKNVSHTFVH